MPEYRTKYCFFEKWIFAQKLPKIDEIVTNSMSLGPVLGRGTSGVLLTFTEFYEAGPSMGPELTGDTIPVPLTKNDSLNREGNHNFPNNSN